MRQNLILRTLILVGIFTATTIFGLPVSAQTPPCSNKWFEVYYMYPVAGPILTPGKHKVWIGQKNTKQGTISNWKSFGPFQIVQGKEYIATVTNGAVSVSASSTSVKYAYIKYVNKDQKMVYAVCTQQTP
jgi:hypothetical protein